MAVTENVYTLNLTLRELRVMRAALEANIRGVNGADAWLPVRRVALDKVQAELDRAGAVELGDKTWLTKP